MRKQSNSLRQAILRNRSTHKYIFTNAMDQIPLNVSNHHNAKYTKWDGLRLIIDAAVANTSPADRSRLIRDSDGYAPTGEWIRKKIKDTCEEPIEDIFNGTMSNHLSEIKQLGRFPCHPIVGVDRTSFSRYDKDNPDLIKGRAKDGTTTFETYLSAQLVNADTRVVIATFPVKKGEKNASFMPKIVDLYEKESNIPALFVLDRGFYSAALIKYTLMELHTCI